MKRTFFALSLFVGSIPSIGQSARSHFTIVAYGTSLTWGSAIPDERWTSLLEGRLKHRHPDVDVTVINAGISGSTTRERMVHLQAVLDQHPDLVIHDFAVNDATEESGRHVSLEEFSRNIETMHDRVKGIGAFEIYWPQTPIISEKHVWRNQPLILKAGGLDRYAEDYRKCVAMESRRLGIDFVDMDAVFREYFKEKGADYYLQPDGIHYLRSGNQLVADCLLPVVEKVMTGKGEK